MFKQKRCDWLKMSYTENQTNNVALFSFRVWITDKSPLNSKTAAKPSLWLPFIVLLPCIMDLYQIIEK